MKIYTRDFKLKAIKKYKEGVKPDIILREVEDLSKHNKYYSKNTLKRWTQEYEEKGNRAFVGIGKNTKKILSKNWEKELNKLSLEEQNEYLKTKLMYLEAERNFLAKLPQKKQN